MTKVFVHGNPETTFVWSELVAELEKRGIDDIILLSPPGFGAPVPEGFGGTRLDYRDWLIGQIEALDDGPVDLVGHDWGAGPHLRRRRGASRSVAIVGCRLRRSPSPRLRVASRCPGLADRGRRREVDRRDDRTRRRSNRSGVRRTGDAWLADIADHLDAEMGRAILTLYRSAAQPAMRELGDQLAAADRRPSLLLHATADPYVPPDMAFAVAERIGAEILTLEGLAHWWMFENPGLVADGLVAFWSERTADR